MNMAFRKKDFKAANKYGKLSGSKSIKAIFSKSRMLFYLYVWLKDVKKRQSLR